MKKLFFFLVCFGASGLLMYLVVMAFLDPHPLLGFFVTVCTVALVTGGVGVLYTRMPVTNTHRRVGAGILVGVLTMVFALNWLFDRRAMSEELQATARANAQKACVSFIDREFNRNRLSNPAFAVDAWEKRGSIVVEVGWSESRSSQSFSSRLCVYSPESGRLTSPGAFGRNRWERW